MKVTLVPAQTAPEGTAVILTLAGRSGLIVIEMVLLVAGEPDVQVAFDVILTVIEAPLVKVVDVYDTPVAPAIVAAPLYHW